MRPPNQHVSMIRMILTIAGARSNRAASSRSCSLGCWPRIWAYMSQPVYRQSGAALPGSGWIESGGAARHAVPASDSSLPCRRCLFSHALLEKLVSEFGLYPGTVARFGLVVTTDSRCRKHDLFFSAPREGYSFRIAFEATTPELAQMVRSARLPATYPGANRCVCAEGGGDQEFSRR